MNRHTLCKNQQSLLLMALAVLALLCTSCDVDLFGSTWKQLAAGYQLVQSEIPHKCGVIPPGRKFGSLAGEIGWRKPFIIFREASPKPWTVIDTRTGMEISISDGERTGNPNYAEILTYQADDAWRRLSRFKRQW